MDPLTIASAHDALRSASGPQIVALDWERSCGWRVSHNGQPATSLTTDALLRERFADATFVVLEDKHSHPRGPYSVSLPLTAEQIEALPFRHKLKLFPGNKTWKASQEAGHVLPMPDGQTKADKTKDAESIALWALAHPRALAAWPLHRTASEDPNVRLHDARDALRDDIKSILNPLRVAWNALGMAEKYALPHVVTFCGLIERQYDAMSPELRAQFGIARKPRAGLRIERLPSAITLYFAVCDADGRLRLAPDGRPLGTRFILSAIGMSHRYRPNMARSQLTYWGMRHYKGTRCEYMRNLRHFLHILRSDAQVTRSQLSARTTRSPIPAGIMAALPAHEFQSARRSQRNQQAGRLLFPSDASASVLSRKETA